MNRKFTDQELVQALNNKDETAFDVFLTQNQSRISVFLKRFSQLSEADIDDILQETFITFWTKMKTGDPIYTLDGRRAMLYAIAKNKLREFFRAKFRSSSRMVRYVESDTWENEAAVNIWKAEAHFQVHEEISVAVQKLPAGQVKEIIDLVFKGYTLTEIATHLDTSYHSVANKKGKGMLTVAEIIKNTLKEQNTPGINAIFLACLLEMLNQINKP